MLHLELIISSLVPKFLLQLLIHLLKVLGIPLLNTLDFVLFLNYQFLKIQYLYFGLGHVHCNLYSNWWWGWQWPSRSWRLRWGCFHFLLSGSAQTRDVKGIVELNYRSRMCFPLLDIFVDPRLHNLGPIHRLDFPSSASCQYVLVLHHVLIWSEQKISIHKLEPRLPILAGHLPTSFRSFPHFNLKSKISSTFTLCKIGKASMSIPSLGIFITLSMALVGKSTFCMPIVASIVFN